MGDSLIFVVGTLLVYIAVLAGIGEYARRKTALNREDFFMGSRNFKTVALLFSLLATQLTAFTMIGVPGMAYREGIGVYGYVASAATLIIPLVLATVGYRLWIAGKRFGHITPGQFVNHRYESSYLGMFVMALLVFWSIPYLLLGAVGGGIAFSALTQNVITYPVGVAIVLVVVFLYVMAGGMRGTTYTNIFQGGLFILLLMGFLTYFGVKFGGFEAATTAAIGENAELAVRPLEGPFSTQGWFSFFLLTGLAIPMFPHMFMRILTGKSVTVYKRMVALFPIGVAVAFIPAVFLGFWGAGQITGLEGQTADQILPMLFGQQLPLLLLGLGIVVILAAIMSTLDAQTLTVSTMFTEDLVRPLNTHMTERMEILVTRILLAGVFFLTFGLALMQPGTVFWIGEFAFQGFALIFYPTMIGLYWRRANRYGVWTGLITGLVGIWLFQLGVLPGTLSYGFMPFVPVLVAQIFVVHAVSYLTISPSQRRVREYTELFRGVW